MDLLRKKIDKLLEDHVCHRGIVIINLQTGEKLAINPENQFPAASMIKIPIMYEIMRQAAFGNISLEDELTVSEEVIVDGAGILKELRPNIKMTVLELVTLMIILSDNTATNMLIDYAGMDNINSTIKSLGLKSTLLQRRMMDFDAAKSGRENFTTAADISLILNIIFQKDLLPVSYCEQMLDILIRQQVRDKLPFYLPEDTIIANKTGTLPGFEHDGGILFLPYGAYIISVFTGNLTANYEGLLLVAEIGKTIYEHFAFDKENTACAKP
ncbi:serine hydrolase [Dendrosporobacter sp. 1207_IL3150]|uniref:serine hydrolase n=1 Tax=Dendrosporobacter sp. 1207_IL3150 TaxID=3084054 RepID=UPI002FD9C791